MRTQELEPARYHCSPDCVAPKPAGAGGGDGRFCTSEGSEVGREKGLCGVGPYGRTEVVAQSGSGTGEHDCGCGGWSLVVTENQKGRATSGSVGLLCSLFV